MQNTPSEKASPHLLQIHALRDALERAARAATNAESVVRELRSELLNEQRKFGHSTSEVQRLMTELEQAGEENKRLRRSVGELFQERETLTERIRQLSSGAGTAEKPVLEVVEPPNGVESEEHPEVEYQGTSQPNQRFSAKTPTGSNSYWFRKKGNGATAAVAPVRSSHSSTKPEASGLGGLRLAPANSGPLAPGEPSAAPVSKSTLKLAEGSE